MIRRWIALALVALAVVTIAPPSSRAQIPMIANGIIHATVASVNVANTTSEQLLYQYTIPAALLATWTTSNTAFGTAPLHLRLHGGIRTLGTVGGITGNSLAVNLGGSSATMMVVNGAAIAPDLGSGNQCAGGTQPGACPAPVALDVYISPLATRTSQNCTDLRACNPSVYMAARFVTASTTLVGGSNSFATENAYNAATLAVLNLNQSSFTLNVLYRWGSAASGNSLNIYNGVLKLGF